MKKITRILSALSIAALAASTIGFSANAASKQKKGNTLRKNLITFQLLTKELDNNYVDTLDYDKLFEDAIYGLLYNVDPYTEYIKKENQGDLKQLSTGKFGGIGSYIQRRGDLTIISAPQEGTPSKKAGLRHGDRIIMIDTTEVTKDMNISEVSNRLQGKPGTTVKVKVNRPYEKDSILTFDIVRAEIESRPITYYGMITPSAGYIKLSTFSANTAEEMRKAVTELSQAPGIKGLIIDLRGNTGGLLEAAVASASCFVPKGTEIVRVVYKDKSKKVYRTTRQPIAPELPLVILTDGMTASSSEILAGSLQDLDRAALVGNRSYGKGLVQISRPLPDDALLKVTVGKYYIPSGRLIQAINYRDRDENGRVNRIPDSLTKVFHTRVGREVRDGNGITPDSIVKEEEVTRLVYTLMTDNWIYDYATKYRAANPRPVAAEKFEINDTIYGDFKKYISENSAKLKYDRATETGLKYIEDAVKAEGYTGDSIQVHINALKELLKHDLNHDLDFNRKAITKYLDSELSERYYTEREAIKRSLRTDKDVEAAIKIIDNPARYRKMLMPKK